MKCPKCDKEMIKRPTGNILCTYPPQFPWNWWCGGCNHYEQGGVDRGKTDDEIYREEWQKLQ